MKKILVSFIHGYRNLKQNNQNKLRPCLLKIENNTRSVYSYPFPRSPKEFDQNEIVVGKRPLKNSLEFKKMPRYGLMGLAQDANHYYAGSWNGVYQLNKKDLSLKKIISHQLMSDLHGISINKGKLLHMIIGLDTVVMTDLSGNIIDFFSIDKNLKIKRDKSILKVDWRFITKQHRGSTGFFHFNHIQVINKKIWITSRNLNCFIMVDLLKNKATLRTMNFSSVALIHDGYHYKDQIYLTSIDGKIIIADKTQKSSEINRTGPNKKLFNRDLIAQMIDINHNIIKGKSNWCRGIKVTKDRIFITIDGRYDSKLRFSLLEIDKYSLKLIHRSDYSWSKLDKKEKLRYVTGFDILID